MADLIKKASQLSVQDNDDSAANVFPHSRYLAGVAAPKAAKLSSTQKANARKKLTEFLRIAEAHNDQIHYTQHRPFDPTVDPTRFGGDCSSYITQAFAWALKQIGKPYLHDPNGPVEYDGYGFTGSLLATNHEHQVPIQNKNFIGDIAIYGSFWETKHCTICKVSGTRAESVWSSHGSEIGPLQVKVDYRDDLLVILRPVSLL